MDSESVPPDVPRRFFGNNDAGRWAIVAVCVGPLLPFVVAALLGGHIVAIVLVSLVVGPAIVVASLYLRLGYELDGHILRPGQRGRASTEEGVDLRRVYRTGPARKAYLDLYTRDDAERRAHGRPPFAITRVRMSQTAQRELREVMEQEYGIDCTTFRITLGERGSPGTDSGTD